MNAPEKAAMAVSDWLFRRPICQHCDRFRMVLERDAGNNLREVERILKEQFSSMGKTIDDFQGACPDCFETAHCGSAEDLSKRFKGGRR